MIGRFDLQRSGHHALAQMLEPDRCWWCPDRMPTPSPGQEDNLCGQSFEEFSGLRAKHSDLNLWTCMCVCFCAAAHYAMCAATFLLYSYPLADRSAVVTLQFRRVIYDLDVCWRASAGRCRPLAEHEIACNVLDPRVRRKEVCQVCNVQLFSGERCMS